MPPKKTSLILGWPTQNDRQQMDATNRQHPLMKKHRERDLSYAIHYDGDGHLVTFAPTGSGKGVSVIIPNLLHYKGPAIVIDPKGENFAITARYRIDTLGQKVMLLDPFHSISDGMLEKYNVTRGKLNPLDICKTNGTDVESNAQMLAGLLSSQGGMSSDPFWDNAARSLLSGIIAHEMDMSLRENRPASFQKAVSILYAANASFELATLLDEQNPTKFTLQAIGGGFITHEEKTKSGILATAQSYVSTMTSGMVSSYLDASTINLNEIQTDENYTLYIVVPPNKLESHSFLLKMWIGALMLSVMERKNLPALRTLFILDECANLGEMDVLRKAVTLLRGYGLQVWMFFQDVSQMQFLYKEDHKTMINNCGVFQSFGIHRKSASEPIASIVGEYRYTEIMKLDRTQQLISLSPGRVRIIRLFRYYIDQAFSGRHDANPLIRGCGNKSMTKGLFRILGQLPL